MCARAGAITSPMSLSGPRTSRSSSLGVIITDCPSYMHTVIVDCNDRLYRTTSRLHRSCEYSAVVWQVKHLFSRSFPRLSICSGSEVTRPFHCRFCYFVSYWCATTCSVEIGRRRLYRPKWCIERTFFTDLCSPSCRRQHTVTRLSVTLPALACSAYLRGACWASGEILGKTMLVAHCHLDLANTLGMGNIKNVRHG